MHHGRFCLWIFVILSFFSHSSTFSYDQQIFFKHDMTNTKYNNLYCDNNPLCSKWNEMCKSYVRYNNDNDTTEYCRRLIRICYESKKCCTGKTGCCNGNCDDIYNQNAITMLSNIITLIFLFFGSYYFKK